MAPQSSLSAGPFSDHPVMLTATVLTQLRLPAAPSCPMPACSALPPAWLEVVQFELGWPYTRHAGSAFAVTRTYSRRLTMPPRTASTSYQFRLGRRRRSRPSLVILYQLGRFMPSRRGQSPRPRLVIPGFLALPPILHHGSSPSLLVLLTVNLTPI